MMDKIEQKNKGHGGRKPKHDYTSEEFLSRMELYAKKGLTDKEIASEINITPETFCRKKNEYKQLYQALAHARDTVNATVRAKFLALGLGGIKTKNTIRRKIRDSNGNETGEEEIQVTEIELAPSLQALSTWLYHHDEEWRKIERKQDESEDIPKDIEHGVYIESWIKGEVKK